eukprot:COSAG01_NODE_843_length_13172_cov_84.009791_8_plen_863_part_00
MEAFLSNPAAGPSFTTLAAAGAKIATAGAREPDDDDNLRASAFEKRLAAPPGTETCPDYFAHLRPPSRLALSTTQGARTPLATAALYAGPLGALSCLYAAAVCAFGNRGDVGFSRLDGTLAALMLVCLAAALCGLSLVAEQLRLVLRPGGGELALLGAGSAKITASALGALERWHRLMRGLGIFFAVLGVVLFFWGIIGALRGDPNHVDIWYLGAHVLWIAPVGLVIGLGFSLLFQFLLSLEAAQTLATERAMEVVRAATELTPTDAEGRWGERVEAAALALKDGAIGVLSHGWGKGLATCYAIFWGALGPACFLETLNVAAKPDILGAAAWALISLAMFAVPLWLSTGVARTSTACDDVMRQLNLVRIADSAYHAAVLHLETSLRNLNDGQGLGFLVGLTVLDKAKLKSLIFGVGGLFSTVLPLVLVLYSKAMASHEATFTPALATGVLEFDGTNAYTLPPSGDLVLDANGNAFAFGGWIKVEDTSSRYHQRVFDFSSGGRSNSIDIDFFSTTGKMSYAVFVEEWNSVQTTDKFPLHQWVHVAVIHTNSIATIYWDGVVKARGPVHMPPQATRDAKKIGMSNQQGSDQPIAPGTQMHDLAWYNTADITIEQIRSHSGPEPVLSAGMQIAPAPIRATGPSGWLALNGSHSAADSSQSLAVGQAFDGDATTSFTTCCGAAHWVEYALPSAQTVERYYLLASDSGCPSAWHFQAQQCNYTQAFPYTPYLPSCEWITLDSRQGERCNNHTTVDPATFDIAKTQQRGAARYRWLFDGASTLTELGMGSSAADKEEQESNVNCHRHRRTQQQKLQEHEPPTNNEVVNKVAELEALVREQQTMIAELKQEQKESMKELMAAIMTNNCK